MHRIIIGRGIGYQGVVFIATANKDDQKRKSKKAAESGSHCGIHNKL
jgi:hypothetical protein